MKRYFIFKGFKKIFPMNIMISRSVSLLLLTSMMLASCQRSLYPESKDRIREEVKTVLTNNFEDIKKSGFIAEARYLYQSPDFFWIPPRQSTPISYDSVVTILRNATPLYKKVESKWESLHIFPVSKNMATYAGKYQSVYTNLKDVVSTFNMMETGNLIRKKGKWYLVSGHTSIIPNK